LKLLIIWRELPNSQNSSTSRIYYLIKNAKKYNLDIKLLTFRSKNELYEKKDDLSQYCNSIVFVDKPREIGSLSGFFSIFKNFIGVKDVSFYDRFGFSSFISLEMRRIIKKLITTEKFDLIYVDYVLFHNSLFYNKEIPMVLDFLDPILYPRYQLIKYEKSLKRKLRELLLYYRSKFFEVPYYKYFDACVFVAKLHEELLNEYLPEKRFIVPYGVDTDYFKSESNYESFKQCVVFTGGMYYLHNVNAVLYFYKEIFPIIKNKIPEIKFYIVGTRPPKEVLKLKSDKSVIVTGYVNDIRPYLSKSSVVIAPMITDDGGFKIKILEAMAMGKPIVSTTIGAKALNVSDDENIIIADNPNEFAKKIVTLINDKQGAENLGDNARKFVEEEYSWPQATDMIVKAFNEFL
jgi:polysaccharide biosynthesis protein PslH